MRIKLNYLTPLLVAGAAAAAIAAAPTAMAASAPNPPALVNGCTANGICPNTHSHLAGGQAPGNVQLNDGPGFVQTGPQYPYAEGDYFGGPYGHGGFGGGFGGGGFGGGHGGGGGHGR
jgi:hypothetical protein